MRPSSPAPLSSGHGGGGPGSAGGPALGAAPAGEGTTLERAPILAAQADDAEGRRPAPVRQLRGAKGAPAIFAGSAARQRHRSTWTMALHSATDATADLLWRTGLFGSLSEADDCRPSEGHIALTPLADMGGVERAGARLLCNSEMLESIADME